MELGSGWGQLAIDLARQNPQRQVIGYEMSLIPFCISSLRNRFFGPPNLAFKREDFFNAPLEEAGVLVCYLFPGAMSRLAESLPKETEQALFMISNTFRLPGFEADEMHELTDLYRTRIYRYSIPVKGR